MKLKRNIAISESGFVFDPGTGESFSLNETGREIMELLREKKTFDEIAGIISSRYEVKGSGFEKSFLDFLAVLKNFHLLEQDTEN